MRNCITIVYTDDTTDCDIRYDIKSGQEWKDFIMEKIEARKNEVVCAISQMNDTKPIVWMNKDNIKCLV